MTQEDKELLLKDLSARLSYGVKAQYGSRFGEIKSICTVYGDVDITIVNNKLNNRDISLLVNIKPYLRSMSSMTEEEREEYEMLQVYPGFKTNHTDLTDMYDFLNAHHFDYRGLIPMGLALEAPEDMYKKN